MDSGGVETLQQIPSIIEAIKTPLSLAALFLLILAFLVQLFLRNRSNANARRIASLGIFAAAAICLIALALPIVADWLKSADEIPFRGSVRDDKGSFVAGATIDLGVFRTQTQPDGRFETTIPPTRAASTYTGRVTAPGFQDLPVDIVGPTPAAQDFVLQHIIEQPPSIYINNPTVTLSVFFGVPEVQISIGILNPTSQSVTFENFTVVLTDDKKLSHVLYPTMFIQPNNSFSPASASIAVPADGKLSVPVIWGDGASINALFNSLTQAFGARGASQCTVAKSIDVDVFTQISQFFDNAFIWKTGPWNLSLQGRLAGKLVESSADFTITADDEARMRNVKALISGCQAVNWPGHLVNTGTASSYIEERLRVATN